MWSSSGAFPSRLKDKALAEHVDAEHLLESLLDLEYRCRARQGQRGNDVTGHEADDVHSVLSGGALLARSTNIRLPQRFHLALLLATCGELAASTNDSFEATSASLSNVAPSWLVVSIEPGKYTCPDPHLRRSATCSAT
eukprot:CAMPEP_0175615334 /NCGR_PEP_ID=MMETSP0096-20121207/65315_1 /TAXON_ID=311494 /ORGANISM="Alexandrium monilatum, Strain CCMP3105" /LENGTH=138 /DNA_ID=CAMNT_0016920467 /DNA_START=33 /DNA_END=447 /DNA_ORIENTATION=-